MYLRWQLVMVWISLCLTTLLLCWLQAVASECGISAMPTFQVFKDGKKIDEMVGASKEKLNDMVAKYA